LIIDNEFAPPPENVDLEERYMTLNDPKFLPLIPEYRGTVEVAIGSVGLCCRGPFVQSFEVLWHILQRYYVELLPASPIHFCKLTGDELDHTQNETSEHLFLPNLTYVVKKSREGTRVPKKEDRIRMAFLIVGDERFLGRLVSHKKRAGRSSRRAWFSRRHTPRFCPLWPQCWRWCTIQFDGQLCLLAVSADVLEYEKQKLN